MLVTDRTCADLTEQYRLTIAELLSWNTWIQGGCDTGLYAGLSDDDTRSSNTVCIATTKLVPGGPSSTSSYSSTSITSTQSTTQSKTTSTKTTSSVNIPAPTQPGIPGNCSQYYKVVENDSCAAIQAKFVITFQQFLA